MNVTRLRVLAGALLVIGTGIANAADGPLVATDVKQVDRDYWFQGEYLGSTRTACGRCESCGLQVVALGKNDFQAVLYRGGLPGSGWWTGMTKHDLKGKRDGETLRLIGDDATQRIEISKSTATVQAVHQPPTPGSEQIVSLGELIRIERRSQTLGAAA